jgi:hypothetical protein
MTAALLALEPILWLSCEKDAHPETFVDLRPKYGDPLLPDQAIF